MMQDIFAAYVGVGDEFCVRWTGTLMHFLWQGAVVGLLAVVADRLLDRRSTTARYTLHTMALLSLPLCVAVTFVTLDVASVLDEAVSDPLAMEPPGRHEKRVTRAGQGEASSPRTAGERLALDEQTRGKQRDVLPEPTTPAVVPPAAADMAVSGSTARRWLARGAPVITVLYLAGVACLFLRLLLGIRGGNQLRSHAVPLEAAQLRERIDALARSVGLRFVPLVAYCEEVAVPTVVGVLRPAVLLPISTLTGLESQQLLAIIAHELAHIRRHDLVMNLVQRLIESLLFFHPAVWYISRRMSMEREACCDDAVVRSGCERTQYADALLRMAELCVLKPRCRAVTLAATGRGTSQLEQRVWRLLDTSHHQRQRLTRSGLLLIASLPISLILTLAIVSGGGRAETRVTNVTSATSRQAETDEFYSWDCSTVDEATGEPVANVRVIWEFCRRRIASDGNHPMLWKNEFVSDQHGAYTVRAPRAIVDAARSWLRIAYHHPRYLPRRGAFWPLRMPDDPVGQQLDHRHIQLKPGVRVFGVVTQPDGTPARNIPVMFARNREGFGDSNGGYYHGFWTNTDDNGRYEFYTRDTWPQRIHWYPDEYAADSRALTRDFGEQAPIRLKPGLTLTGKVIDAQGQPLAGVVVRASTGTRVPYLFATADAQGVFRFSPLPPGNYNLVAVRSYHDTRTGESLSASLPFPIPAIEYPLNESTASVEPRAVIQASPLITIPVEVVDGSDVPVTDARLSIGDLSSFMNAVLAEPVEGEPGRYAFRFPRDQYISDLTYRRSMDEAAFYQLNPNHPPVAAEAIVLGKAQEDLPTVRVVVRKAASLTVRARTQDGNEPTEDVQVSGDYSSATEDRIKAAERANRDPQAHFTMPRMIHTQPAEQFWNPTFQHLVPGEPLVVTVRSNTYTAQPMVVILKDGEEKSVELTISKIGDTENPPTEPPLIPDDDLPRPKMPPESFHDGEPFEVSDPASIHAMALPVLETLTWQWRVHIPPGTFELHWGFDEISSQGVGAQYTKVGFDLQEGEQVLTCAIRRDVREPDNKWVLICQTTRGNATRRVLLPQGCHPWFTEQQSIAFAVSGVGNELVVNAATEPLVLLRQRRMAFDEDVHQVKREPPEKKREGLLLWIAPRKRQ